MSLKYTTFHFGLVKKKNVVGEKKNVIGEENKNMCKNRYR